MIYVRFPINSFLWHLKSFLAIHLKSLYSLHIEEMNEKKKRQHIGKFSLFCIFFILLSNIAFAHDVPEESFDFSLEHMDEFTWKILFVASALIIVLVTLALRFEHQTQSYKTLLFLGIFIPVVFVSLFLIGTTIYGNVISVTQGPVHWHADYEVWVCNQKLDLIDPRGLSNRIGTPTLHQHNDDRIHVEGVVYTLDHVDLGHYFSVIGGTLEPDRLIYPTETGIETYKNGDLCGEHVGTLSVYVNGKRIAEPQRYVMTQTAYVPPGDCIIIEFGIDDKDTTQRMCASWAAKGWTYEE